MPYTRIRKSLYPIVGRVKIFSFFLLLPKGHFLDFGIVYVVWLTITNTNELVLKKNLCCIIMINIEAEIEAFGEMTNFINSGD